MKRVEQILLVLIGIFLWGLTNQVQAQPGEDLNFILSQLKDRFDAAKTFQADYVREIVPKIASSCLPHLYKPRDSFRFFLRTNSAWTRKNPGPSN